MLKNLNNLQIAVLCDDDSDDNVKWDEDCEPARIRARLITNWEPRRLSGLDFGSETARQRFEVSTPIQHAGERPINPLSPEWIATFVLASIRAMTGGLWSIPADDLQQLYVWLDAEYEDGDDEDSAIVPLESEVTRLAGVIAQARAHIGEWLEWAQGIALDDERRISLPGPPRRQKTPQRTTEGPLRGLSVHLSRWRTGERPFRVVEPRPAFPTGRSRSGPELPTGQCPTS